MLRKVQGKELDAERKSGFRGPATPNNGSGMVAA
jgi:hypothetical protein